LITCYWQWYLTGFFFGRAWKQWPPQNKSGNSWRLTVWPMTK
jgi:hypothetical protein